MSGTEVSQEQSPAVVYLADYRHRRHCNPRTDRWVYYRRFCARFSEYLRERLAPVGVTSDGLDRLAVAFDLRSIRLTNIMLELQHERDVTDQAAHALSMAKCLARELSVTHPAADTVSVAAAELAHALDMVIASLDFSITATNTGRR